MTRRASVCYHWPTLAWAKNIIYYIQIVQASTFTQYVNLSVGTIKSKVSLYLHCTYSYLMDHGPRYGLK